MVSRKVECHGSRENGFSLIEVVVVSAIIAILLGLGSVSYSKFINQTRLRTATDVVASNLRQARQLAIGTRTPHRVVFSVPEQDPQLDTLPQEIWIQTKRVAQGATNYTGSENWVDVTDPKRLPDGVRIMSFSGKEPGAPPSASEMYCAEFNFRGQMTKSYFLPERQVSSISLYVHLQRIGEEVDPNEEDHRLTVNSVEILRLTGRVRTYDYGYGSPFATTEYRG